MQKTYNNDNSRLNHCQSKSEFGFVLLFGGRKNNSTKKFLEREVIYAWRPNSASFLWCTGSSGKMKCFSFPVLYSKFDFFFRKCINSRFTFPVYAWKMNYSLVCQCAIVLPDQKKNDQHHVWAQSFMCSTYTYISMFHFKLLYNMCEKGNGKWDKICRLFDLNIEYSVYAIVILESLLFIAIVFELFQLICKLFALQNIYGI